MSNLHFQGVLTTDNKDTNKKAAIVIGYTKQAKTVSSINLFSNDDGLYNKYYGPIKSQEQTYRLANADPAEHETIHKELARLMSMNPEDTKHMTRHFHWVPQDTMDADLFGGFLGTLLKARLIDKKTLQSLLQPLA